VELEIPGPTEQRTAVPEDDRPDRGTVRRRWHLESIPEHEANARRGDGALDARERPAIQAGRGHRSDLVGEGRNRKRANVFGLHSGLGYVTDDASSRLSRQANASGRPCNLTIALFITTVRFCAVPATRAL